VTEKPKDVHAADADSTRGRQLAYSELQKEMLNEESRRRKAAKIISVLQHFLGREDLDGLKALDIGCSTGFISDELHKAGARVTGLDIDEPGLQAARLRFGESIELICAGGEDIPAPPQSFDIVIFNHIYEHVVDAEAVMAEIRRVLRPDGVVYLGLGNRMGILEPHYKLPFLSWLPKRAADRYVRATGKASTYYETFRTRRNLRRMCAGLNVWDYTYTVLAQSRKFAADDMVPRRLSAAPTWFWKSLAPVIPTFIWVGTLGLRHPAGPATTVLPAAVPARRS
jgi:2-polyprenyl-3-methyl-5-hydroxy-6-metoxy-1,4-benzoquinol methylase